MLHIFLPVSVVSLFVALKVTLSDQVQVTLQVTVFRFSVKDFSRSALAGRVLPPPPRRPKPALGGPSYTSIIRSLKHYFLNRC